MKRLLSMLLAAAMLLTLAACSPATLKGAGATSSQPPQTSAAPSTQEPTDPPTEASTEESASEATEAPAGPSLLGRYDGDAHVYYSEMLSAQLSLDSDWTVFGPEELAELNGVSVDVITEEGMAEKFQPSGAAMVVFCAADALGDSVVLTYEKLSAINTLILTEDAYASIASTQLEEQLTEQGLEDVEVEITTFNFDGKTCAGVQSSGAVSGVPIRQGMACVKVDSYMVVVAVTVMREDLEIQDLLDLFTPWEG